MLSTTHRNATLYFFGDEVRARGLTVESIAALFAEWPLAISVERNRDGIPAILATLVYEADEIGDASLAELEETAARTGLRHAVSYDTLG